MNRTLRIAGRYNGPAHSAHGGYACGLFARQATEPHGVPGALAVTLHAPPPLDTALRTEHAGRRVHIWAGDELVATVRVTSTEIGAVDFAAPTLAERAEEGFPGLRGHPFPTCFVCGIGRQADGVGLRPGPLPDRPTTMACTWTARGEVADELVWAVLDCAGGWLVDQARTPMVLAHMAARVSSRPRPDELTVAVGRLDSLDPSAALVTTTLYRSDGTELGRANATWSRLSR